MSMRNATTFSVRCVIAWLKKASLALLLPWSDFAPQHIDATHTSNCTLEWDDGKSGVTWHHNETAATS